MHDVKGIKGMSNHKIQIRRSNVEKILIGAEKVFAEKGFAGAAMADIAAEVQLPRSNLHYYFSTKQKTAYEIADSDWSSDVCSSDLQQQNP